MDTGRLAHLHVTRNDVTIRNIQHRLGQCAHALIMKRPTDNVTLTLGYPVGGEQNSSSKHSFGGRWRQLRQMPAALPPNICAFGNSSHRLSPRANLRSEK